MKCLLTSLMICWTLTLSAQDWPREVVSPQGTITIYQPQIASFQGNALGARAAISITPNGKDEPVFGAVWLDCRVSTDRTSRTVRLEDVKVKQIRFPNGTDEETSKISATLEEQMPHLDLTFSLDLLLESLETAQKERETARELEVTPPKIIVMNHPAVLLLIDGQPVLTDVEGTSLKRVTNTPFFLVQVPSSGRFYLRGGAIWFSARNITGPWRKADNPPKVVVDLSEQSMSNDESDDQLKVNDVRLKTGKIPEIVVSTVPAELIATDGPMQLAPIKGTGLLYASNTPSRLFLEIASQQYYILVSGRWYNAKTLTGPWTNVESKKLPADFANIPPGSECDDVLSSVAGTIPAREAILDAQIPQTAEVDRATATTEVQYDGDPQFEPIENTGMEYAVNTPSAVIRFGGMYYNCDKGVWFEGSDAFGPWAVCVNVPDVIYTIPPRYPVYNVRYVRVYGYNPSVAYVGYTAGYTGCYVYRGTVVYGTGYTYHSWYRHNYYARPWTWGFGVHYDPWTSWSLGVSVGWGQPHGWFAYNARTVSAGWWGPGGSRPVYRPFVGPAYRDGYRPSYHPVIASKPAAPSTGGMTRNSGATRTGTMYDQWNRGVRRAAVGENAPRATVPSRPAQPAPARPDARPTARPQPPANPAPETKAETRVTPRPQPPVNPGPETKAETRVIPRPPTRENNVYAAPDGNVLRKTPQGWQQRDRNTWKDAGKAPVQQGVDRDQQARQRAADRTTSFKTPPPSQPTPKAQPAAKDQPKRDAGADKKKEEKKDEKKDEKRR
ncbi:MAG: hypothetical protein NTZ35_12955 [Ignavibacteriales bacterium]|nr:hypothetical protein [Ignavibacteriales bacterium]